MIRGTPSLATAKPTEPSTARSTTWPPERTTQMEPKVWSKMASSGTRESMHPTTTAWGCWPPEAAAAAETRWPCSGRLLTKRLLPATSSASASAAVTIGGDGGANGSVVIREILAEFGLGNRECEASHATTGYEWLVTGRAN